MSELDKRSDFITRYAIEIEALLNAIESLNAKRGEYDALGYNPALTDDDFVGDNAYMTAAEFTAGISSIEALDTFLSAGHYTNLYTVSR